MESQYRKKGEGDKPKYQEKKSTTEDAYRPPTRGGGRRDGEDRPGTARGRGERGRGGRGRGGPREEYAPKDDRRGGDNKTRGNTRGGRGGADDKREEGGRVHVGARKPLDENSW